MYGDEGLSNASLLAERPEIFIANIPDRHGQILRNFLIDRLYTNGRPTNFSYELDLSPIKEENTEMGIKKDSSATRIQVQVSTNMKIVRLTGEEKEVVFEHKIKSVGAHNVLDNQIASLVSREDLMSDILKEMADEIKTQVDLYFYSFLEEQEEEK